MIHLDGSYGEGGGQVLRTSVSLAAITNQPIRIAGIRAGRKKPGMAAQHLTSVRAAAAICGAQLRGDALNSMTLEFIPSHPVQAGNYVFDVTEARQGGSAGAIALVLQTILLPLALAPGDSFVKLRGGTHVAFSPPLSYIDSVYLPLLKRMGVEANVRLNAWGWYPQGGGEADLRVSGNSQLSPINLLKRGELQQIKVLAAVTELPMHIPQRMVHRAETLLRAAGLRVISQPLKATGKAPGAGIFITAEYKNILAGFSAIGEQRITSEKVAETACEQLLAFHNTSAPIEEHLADQLLLPAALAGAASQYQVSEISPHLTTNAWVIEQFGIAQITIDETQKSVLVIPTP